jgi:ribosomal protein L29
MKRKEIKELQAKTPKELWDMLRSLRSQIASLVLDHSQHKVGNVAQISGKKDDIARILTVLTQRGKK